MNRNSKNAIHADMRVCSPQPGVETKLSKSLACARSSDISTSKTETKRSILKQALGGAARYSFLLLCVLVFIVSLGYIAVYGMQYMQKRQENDFLEKYANGEINTMFASLGEKSRKGVVTLSVEKSMAGEVIENTDVEEKTYNEYFEKKRTQIIGLQRSYPDVWGWIDVPGTAVNYVIMQGDTNTKYLYMSYDGKENRFGSVFADFRISRNIQDNRNTIIYGHNMSSARAMFAPLVDFVNDEDSFRNKVINIITPDGLYTYSLFSVYDTDAGYNYIRTDFTSDDDYVSFLHAIAERSVFKKSVVLDKNTKLLTLSTCTVRGDGRRWAFHAVLIGISR